jgi:transcriptional regulator GlxA family with amidase domain
MIGSRVRKNERYRDIVAQAEAIAEAHPETLLRIPVISRALCISERTLQSAFRSVYGQSPRRRLRELRLNKVRQVLLSVDTKTASVTEIASRFGFDELGRFAVDYRKLFGESPSQTLQSAIRSSEIWDSPQCICQ